MRHALRVFLTLARCLSSSPTGAERLAKGAGKNTWWSNHHEGSVGLAVDF